MKRVPMRGSKLEARVYGRNRTERQRSGGGREGNTKRVKVSRHDEPGASESEAPIGVTRSFVTSPARTTSKGRAPGSWLQCAFVSDHHSTPTRRSPSASVGTNSSERRSGNLPAPSSRRRLSTFATW